MALVPYNSKISIECNHYKVANKKEIEEVKKANNAKGVISNESK